MSGAPHRVRLIEALGHARALAKLHPDPRDTHYKKAHAKVRDWMEQILSRIGEGELPTKTDDEHGATSNDARIAAPPANYQLDYNVRTKSQKIKAIKKEAILLRRYRQWLAKPGRTLSTTKQGKLQCDGFEKERHNLIEAKSNIGRDYIRMAVGQLFDYGFQIEKKFGETHMAILLPQKPRSDLIEWLGPLGISVIWREKGAFLDNANGQFT
jgi:hypothetical protein